MKARHVSKLAGLLAGVCLAGAVSASALMARMPIARWAGSAQDPIVSFDEGKQAFGALDYDRARTSLDRVIAALTAGGVQKPDLLVQAYELRARSRFALGDAPGAAQDFSALLLINPGFVLTAGVSTRVVAVFEATKKLTVGQVLASLTPAGDVSIDGKTYAFSEMPQAIDLPVGDHTASVTRSGYRPLSQTFTVAGGALTPLALTLERVSSILTIVTQPAGVEVLLDGTSRGTTVRDNASTEASAPFVIDEITSGPHVLQVRRTCFEPLERRINVEKPGDLTTEPLRLTPAIATAKIETSATGVAVYVDGASRGQAPATFADLCAGPHTIEVRGPRGRFIDRREWKTGDAVTLTANLRSAFPIISAKAGQSLTADQMRTNVERTLMPVKGVLVYVPTPAELDAANKDESAPADWLTLDDPGADPATLRVSKNLRRDLGTRLAARLRVQGVVSIVPGRDPYTLSVLFLAAGSGQPDVITINTTEPGSQARAVDTLSAPLPPLVRPSLETAVIDVANAPGAVVVRVAGAGARAGLTVGDVIIGAGGTKIASVAELRTAIASRDPAAPGLQLDVRGPTGTARTVAATVTMVPETVPLQGPDLFSNRDLVSLGEALDVASTPVEKAAALINLAIVQYRLANFEQAFAALKEVVVTDAPGVSTGTVSYLTGLCLEGLGRTAEAAAAYTQAAAAPQARLSFDGPFVAPLAQLRLRTIR